MKVHVLIRCFSREVVGVYRSSFAAHAAARELGIDAADFDCEEWDLSVDGRWDDEPAVSEPPC